ncbi:hypothetical protein L226DRAFT_452477 [Lentinus tigrinus ALCF2SS1-7]|uniref:non-specific serine/threonine protein kinase n=1 Tax=Lentinus tigrinus ALCF2SS1-6 TaxID=1328759 RepID=A0A5C2SUC9_9APHY|nr:hypothetical protein L227DRAFT_491792 [Lentinus tigrinus ALCF2SS1-6]RPD80845.1 hypothetical protein L226DRAFT_452477 [Lentinus tigrinus ALCF2SS1-7]
MEDDDTLGNADVICRALQEIDDRFERDAVWNPAADALDTLAKQLAALPCILYHANDKCSPIANTDKPRICFVATYMKVAFRMLENDGSSEVRGARTGVYNALGKALCHQTAPLDDRLFDDLTTFMIRGMKNSNVRAARLAAGRALVELVKLVERLDDRVMLLTGVVFMKLRTCLTHADHLVRETALVTTGLIGKTSTGHALRESVCSLVFQMGHVNPILKGTAILQLQAICRQHSKSAYSLAHPYLNRISPYLVRRFVSEHNGLVEFCRFISTDVESFLKLTLRYTLPILFADGDTKVLLALAQTLHHDSKLNVLVFEEPARILAHVFMLQGIGQTNKMLQFISHVMEAEIPDHQTFDTWPLITSCMVHLMAELVGSLGDQDPDVADAANEAIVKLSRLADQRDPLPQGRREDSALLKNHMHGIVSILNDTLQDIKGKQSVETKQSIIRGIGRFVELVGKDISPVGPQIMASFQTTLSSPDLANATLSSWHSFLSTLDPPDLCPYVAAASASLISTWWSLSSRDREIAKNCLHLMVVERGAQLGTHLTEIADLSSIPELGDINEHLMNLRVECTQYHRLYTLLERLGSQSLTVASQSAVELRAFLSEHEEDIRLRTTGDFFDPLAGQLVSALYAAASRDSDGTATFYDLVYECIGVIGAIDPDRLELRVEDRRILVLSNFTDESEATTFALHLIQDVLVRAYRSARELKLQNHIGYALQELLQFCKFTPALVKPGPGSGSVPLKVRNRWNSLPGVVIETCAPLLVGPLALCFPRSPSVSYPIYPHQPTYRQWVQVWTTDLINRVSGEYGQQLFGIFSSLVRYKDVGIAHRLLPHLVANVLAYGDENDAELIRTELLTVLEDQVNPDSQSTPDKRLFSAQTVFMLLDHVNMWLRGIRQQIVRQKNERKRTTRGSSGDDFVAEGQLEAVRVESILATIDEGLLAQAAFQCKAYARTLMHVEQIILVQRERNTPPADLQKNYDHLHEIYAHLDQPDGMEGVSTMILSPTLEHQIRQHESTGRWTSAQSCWEVRLQHEPDNLDYHLGLLRCLRNLGHYDSLRTHVRGVLTNHPNWAPQLVEYQLEGEWMVGHWEEVQNLVSGAESRSPLVLMAQVLLAVRSGNNEAIAAALSTSRRTLGTAITASGPTGYRRSYDAVLNLHLLRELEVISRVVRNLPNQPDAGSQSRDRSFDKLLSCLAARFDSTLPSFRIREAILNMRRTAFNLSGARCPEAREVIGKLWLNSAKIARKAGHSQTAYSAILQARQSNAPFSFVENSKLVRARGEPLRALQELENAMRASGLLASQRQDGAVIDLTGPDEEETKLKAKAHVLHARWMADSERYEDSKVHKEFQTATEVWPKWESGQFHLGQFHDECYKLLSPPEKTTRGMRMNLQTVRSFTRAIRYGSKYIYQTLPRVLTIWLDMAEDSERANHDVFAKINVEVSRAIKMAPVYKWYTAFPQIVSRIGLKNDKAYDILATLLQLVIQEFPKQALWPFTAVAKSTAAARSKRARMILSKLKSSQRNNVSKMIASMTKLTEELLSFCRADVREPKVLSMKHSYKNLWKLFKPEDPSPAHDILIPLQESLTANMPPQSASDSAHQPFPVDAPTILLFFDEVEVMNSLAKPKKMSIRGSNGQIYTFLGKKDDLRKDGRLMDFDTILNKLLKSDSEARRRQLHIRTYSVVSLNEECGLIQWVPNTVPVRNILSAHYARRGKQLWSGELRAGFDKVKATSNNREAAEVFVREVLSLYPPVMHEWFAETFPEPTYWLTSRTAYSRTAAVMSMVGYILGLGDRHCENILLDTNCGDVVHVDFDCLFEKGQALETPEIVPFRLTQNMVDGLGVTGVEGVFRITCEVTLRLLRENKDCLMNVLDAFVHDPLVEWEEKRRRMERHNHVQADMRAVSKDALGPIEEKLRGIFKPLKSSPGKQMTVSNHVQSLIQQACDNANLARMYIGWAPHQ